MSSVSSGSSVSSIDHQIELVVDLAYEEMEKSPASSEIKRSLDNSREFVQAAADVNLPQLQEIDKSENLLRIARNVFLVAAAFLLLVALVTFAVAWMMGAGIFGAFIFGCFFTGAGSLGIGGILALCHHLIYTKPQTPFKEAYREKVHNLLSQIKDYNGQLKLVNDYIEDTSSLVDEIKKRRNDSEIGDQELERRVSVQWRSRVQDYFFEKDEEFQALSIDREEEVCKDLLYETAVADIIKLDDDRVLKM
ncbi:MAG: hypothetical protein S4CHLAM20_02590 [Chlamydiia bacterium]|nr:hypothetical protein [Chlamydiia bacterium]